MNKSVMGGAIAIAVATGVFALAKPEPRDPVQPQVMTEEAQQTRAATLGVNFANGVKLDKIEPCYKWSARAAFLANMQIPEAVTVNKKRDYIATVFGAISLHAIKKTERGESTADINTFLRVMYEECSKG